MTRPPNAAEEAMKQDALATMRSARTDMLMRFPFLGELAMQLEIIPVLDERLPVACTDGNAVYVNAHAVEHPEMAFKKHFLEGKLTGKEDTASAILAHEVWHCALLHFDRGEDKEQRRFNIAADIEIGYLLEKAGIPDLSTARHGWGNILKGAPAEWIYQRIAEPFWRHGTLHVPVASPRSANRPDKDGKMKQNFVDGHYSRGEKMYPPEDSEVPEYGNKNLRDPGFTPCMERSAEEAANLRQKWQDSTKKVASRHGIPGHRPGNLPGNLQNIINSQHKNTVDWMQVLLDYVSQLFGGDRQWLPPARRYVWKKLYLPSRAKKQSIEIVLAIDTSGSTTEDLPDFLAELRGMTSAFGEYKLTIIQCDIAIHSVQEYSNDDPLPEEGLQFKGFGGTSFLAPFRYVEEKMAEAPTVFIYLTDGFGEAPSEAPDYPVIWCLTKGGEKPADWGLEVKIKEK